MEKTMIQGFLDSAEQIWSGWEIRLLVLLSLLLQVVLIVLGNRRKYGCSTWVEFVIWAAYLLSDKVATFSLGVMSTIQSYSFASADKSIRASKAVMVFWAPFLLVHLGGPDTITAYSLEDNDLWLRQFFSGFLVQVGLVFYLLVLSWIRSSVNNDTLPLTFIAIPVFVSGVLKYGEKIWVLWSSSSECFKRTSCPPELPANITVLLRSVIPKSEILVTADWFFKMLKPICSKLHIPSEYYTYSGEFLSRRSPEETFKVIEIELGFLYDVLFSKLSVAHSPAGLILRFISLVSSSAASLAFVIAVDKHNFSLEDIIITYVLVVGAMCAEIYFIVMLIFSQQTLLRLKKQREGFGNFLYRSISASPSASLKHKMWSGSIAQYNIIGLCIDDKPAQFGRIQKFFGIYESLEIGRYKTWEKVTPDLKKMIFANIKGRYGSNSRGAWAIRKRQKDQFLEWSVESLELDRSILIWHIATNICYYSDLNNANPGPSLKAGISKSLSDYMLYLVICRPFMLPTGNWEDEFRSRVSEASTIIRQLKGDAILSRADACQLLFQNVEKGPADYMDARIQGFKPTYRLTDVYWVAKLLLECNDRWDVIAGVWIEMLCYVASKCDWKYHIQELSRGGELLTHVRVLMVHLGLTDTDQTQPGMEDFWTNVPRRAWERRSS